MGPPISHPINGSSFNTGVKLTFGNASAADTFYFKADLQHLIEKYGDSRRTEIVAAAGAVDVVVCSTGLIGLANDRDDLLAGVEAATAALSADAARDVVVLESGDARGGATAQRLDEGEVAVEQAGALGRAGLVGLAAHRLSGPGRA